MLSVSSANLDKLIHEGTGKDVTSFMHIGRGDELVGTIPFSSMKVPRIISIIHHLKCMTLIFKSLATTGCAKKDIRTAGVWADMC